MSKILITVWPYAGSLNPLTGIGQELVRLGHRVAFYSGSRAREHVVSHGFEFFSLADDLDGRIEGLLSAPEGAGRGWARGLSSVLDILRAFFVDTLPEQIRDLDRIVTEWQPDAILCEPAMWGPRVVTHEARRIPLVLWELPATTVPGTDAAPAGLGLARPTGPLTRLQARAAKLGMDIAVRSIRRSVNDLRREQGLGPLRGSVMAMISELPLVLVPGCPQFDYRRGDLPANHRYVGSCGWYPTAGVEQQQWSEGLDTSRPWIHASEGTMYTDQPIVLRSAIAAMGGRDVELICTTGRQRNPDSLDLGTLKPNVRVSPFIPYPDLLPRMDLVVTHGGGGTVIACLAAGVPMVVVPLMWDQSENARRVVFTGAGVKIPASRCTPQRLWNAVQEVVGNPSYKEQALRVASRLGELGGPARAAKLIQEHVLQEPVRPGAIR